MKVTNEQCYYCLFVFKQRRRVPVHVTNESHENAQERVRVIFQPKSKGKA